MARLKLLLLTTVAVAVAVQLNSRAAAVALLHRVGLGMLGWFRLLPMQVPAYCPRERGEETWICCVGYLASLFASCCNSELRLLRGPMGGRLALSTEKKSEEEVDGLSLQCLAAVAK